MKAYKIRTGEHYKQRLGVVGPAAGLTELKSQIRHLPDGEVLVIIGTDPSVFTTVLLSVPLWYQPVPVYSQDVTEIKFRM